MKALASLIGDHQIISRLVNALEVYAQRLKQELPVDARDLAGFAKVFSELADDIHHEKEESILLPLLSRHGFDWSSGVLSLVREEHQQERYLIEVLCHAGQRPMSWNNEDRRHIVATVSALVEFQRNHHQRENTQLFPEVIARLSEAALAQLQAELERFDADPEVQVSRAALVDLAEQLSERYAGDPLSAREPISAVFTRQTAPHT